MDKTLEWFEEDCSTNSIEDYKIYKKGYERAKSEQAESEINKLKNEINKLKMDLMTSYLESQTQYAIDRAATDFYLHLYK